MKKSLLAAALTLATGGAIAQSSVTLYGVIDEGFVKNSETIEAMNQPIHKKNSSHFAHSVSSANRIGFKSEEDLGDGLTAKAKIEFGFGDASQGQSPVHTLRQAWVGLDSQGGHEIKLGRIQSQSFEILAETDASGSGASVGSILSNRDVTIDSRNGIQYMYTQPGYGFGIGYFYEEKKKEYTHFNYQHGEDEIYVSKHSKSKKNTGYELSAHVDDGFLFGKIVYASGIANDNLNYPTYDANHNLLIPAYDAKRTLLTTNVGVKLQPGTKISYTYQNHKLTNDSWNTEGTGKTVDTTKLRGEAHQINFNHMVTPKLEVFSSYSYGLNTNAFQASFKDMGFGDITVNKIHGTGYQLGSRYHFSKRTNIYGIYGKEAWKINISDDIGDEGTLKAKRNSFAVGLKHMF